MHEDDAWSSGHGLVIALRERLQSEGWEVTAPDAWDGGWFVECRADGQALEVKLAQAAGGEWIVQILPVHAPGWLGRLRGKTASASPASCHAVARIVHAALASAGSYSKLRWCWDADPFGDPTTAEPIPPREK